MVERGRDPGWFRGASRRRAGAAAAVREGALALLAAWFPPLLAGCAGRTELAPAAPRTGIEVIVLGIAQDGGLPHLGCRRACCVQARATGRTLDPACLAVVDHAAGSALLVEATPAIERQVAQVAMPLAGVLVTHAHIGHYLGLAHFGREVAAARELPVWGSRRLAAFLRGHGPWSQLVELRQIVLREIEPGVAFVPMPGVTVTALRVPHRDEFSDTMAFRIRGPNRTVLFVPDVDRWDREPGLLERLLEGVDVAYVDGTFWDGRELPGRDLREIPHPPITDTMARLAALARERPGTVRFLHLNHTNPLLHEPELRADLERRGFRVAEQGERVRL